MKSQHFSINNNISNANNGFTIIEVLMAMTIFLIGFLAVGSMQISAVNGNASARMRTSASILAGDIVEQLMRCPYDTSAGFSVVRLDQNGNNPYVGDTDVLASGDHGPFPDDPDGAGPDRTYEVRWTVTENLDDPIKEINVFVRWQRGGQNNSVQYSFLSAAADL